MQKRIVLLLFVLICQLGYATPEIYSVRKQSGDLGPSLTFDIIDGRFSELLAPTFFDKSTQLLLKLGIDENSSYGYIPAFTFTANITINGYNSSNVIQPDQTAVLEITYSPNGGAMETNLHYFKTGGFHKYKITVDPILGTIPDNVYLEAELKIDRFYEISQTVLPVLGCNYIYYQPTTNQEFTIFDVNQDPIPAVGQELEIWWNFIEGAEEYELEWTWVDNYDQVATVEFNERDFELNNTRILTSQQRYRIPLIHAKGYLIYRVRGVGRWTDNFLNDTDKRKYGPWSTSGAPITNAGTNITAWPHYVEITSVHEALKNWQYQAVYAENGKKKEIVSYFDGSLRNRQTVTRINSDKQAIVGESIYDNQGRVAVQILPTPVGNTALRYYQSLNINTAGNPYSHRDFDWELNPNVSCSVAAAAMSELSGAAKYYSPNNTPGIYSQNYVPQAHGFPFVQMEYTPDNTGRIRTQSGVGVPYQIDGDHATKYFYLQPYQEELNRLFGYKVGYKTRYKKNMVVDANGQVSVSYFDPQGRVIATALSGNNTTNLQSLGEELNGHHASQSVDLLNKFGLTDENTPYDDNTLLSTGENGPFNDALILNTQIGATSDNSLHTFTYQIKTSTFSDPCLLEDGGISYPYAYDLTIELQDDCGNSVLTSTVPISLDIDGTTNATYTSSLGVNYTPGTVAALNGFTANLKIGSYTLSKILKIDGDKLDEYVQHYISYPGNCLLQPIDFASTAPQDCYNILPAEDANFVATTCSVTEKMMLADLSPFGQYGAIDPSDLTSVFGTVNVLAQGGAPSSLTTWKNPDPLYPYQDENGNLSYIIVNEISTNVFNPALDPGIVATDLAPGVNPGQYKALPQDLLNLNTFLGSWNINWAKSLLKYHPEYKYKAYVDELCNETALVGSQQISTETYNNNLQLIENYAVAKLPTNVLGVNLIGDPYDPSSLLEINDLDPYFILGLPAYNLIVDNNLKDALMDEIMSNYKNATVQITMWNFAVKAVLCGTDFSGTCSLPLSLAALEGSTTPEQRDQIWAIYKQTYIAEKKKIDQVFMDLYAISVGCYNNYIGQPSPGTPNVSGFLYYPEFLISSLGPYNPAIIELYQDAITAVPGTSPFPWTTNPFTNLFADKLQRFIPIDNLYDASVPETVMMVNTTTQVDAAVFEQTGRCDLSYDVEFLLNGLAQNSALPISSINSNQLPEFTGDLYESLGGTITTSGSPVLVTSNLVGSNIQITANDGAGINLSMGTINVIAPLTGPWSNVVGFSQLYYVPGSVTGGVYQFLVLATMNVAGTYVEEVLSGTTTVAIGGCNYPANCGRDDNFGDNLGTIYTDLFEQGLLTTTNTDITTITGAWYQGSELFTQLDDNMLLPATVTASSTGFIIESDERKITVTYSGSPINASVITGTTYDALNSIVTFYYIDDYFGLPQSFSATVVYEIVLPGGGTVLSTPDLSCGCNDDTEILPAKLKDLFNYLLTDNLTFPIYTLPELTALEPYLDVVPQVHIHGTGFGSPNELLSADLFEFDFIKSGCGVSFTHDLGSTGDLTTLETIINVELETLVGLVYIHITGILSNGTTVHLTSSRIPCFDYAPCKDCTPNPVVPVSCTSAHHSYMTVISSLNAGITSIPQNMFPVYTADEFCDLNIAYVTSAYLHYIDVFSIIDTDGDKYLTIANFGNTNLNYGFYDDFSGDDMLDVVDDYLAYQLTDNEMGWIEFVNTVYLANPEICPAAPMPGMFDEVIPFPCDMLTANIDIVNTINQYDIYLQNTIANFKQRYIEGAINSVVENFDVVYPDKEYHYTLYYYDQAGNLIQTVPPQGVDRIEEQIQGITAPQIQAALDLKNSRQQNIVIANPDILPVHTYQTNYLYNSLNQLVEQKTPDGGTSEFGYDALGRLVVSQNAKQKVLNGIGNEQFSYTRYDGIGRIIEVGEMSLSGLSGGYGFNADGKFVDNAGVIVDVSVANFPYSIGASKEEVTITVYDELNGISPTEFEDYAFDNTRNRITGVKYFDFVVNGITDISVGYNNATFYNYDVHGNVKEVIQVNNDLELLEFNGSTGAVIANNHIKKTKYEYDLVSGNVKEVAYQKDEADQFVHRYNYDDDNRITNVETSRDEIIWEQDAKYFYYEHGPLARTEIGDKKVQASDFAYTVQGWLKGVNSEDLNINSDQGKDAQTNNINSMNAKDVYGYSLHYFDGDYQARVSNDFLAYSSFIPPTPTKDLFNGNIKQMFTANTDFDENYIGTSHTWYEYDQLNRIRTMNQQTLGAAGQPSGYASSYTYDKNGNLQTLARTIGLAGGGTASIDELSYVYNDNTIPEPNNRLTQVMDLIDAPIIDDLTNQSANNYEYDAIGQLISDDQENIVSIKWKVTGKVQEINYNSSSDIQRITFEYDAMGNRIEKKVVYWNPIFNKVTYYVHDAQGNCMAVYTRYLKNLTLEERNIYGSSRVGVEYPGDVLASVNLASNIYVEPFDKQRVGDKRYELSNHLGNVLEVITDRKLSQNNGSGGVDFYTADVVSYADYFCFGWEMPGRSGTDVQGYRYAFNGKESDGEVAGDGNIYDYGFRIYNPRIGRFLSPDPLTAGYPWYTPYQFAGNKPIWAIDVDGLEEWIYVYEFDTETQTATLIEKVHNIKIVTYHNGASHTTVQYNSATGETMQPMSDGATSNQLGTVQYQYVDKEGQALNMRKDYTGNYVQGPNETMPLGQDNWFGSIYIGDVNPTAIVDGKPIADYRREPLDELDLAAYNHDRAYDIADAKGPDGAFNDVGVLSADKKLVHDATIVKEKYYLNQKDDVTGEEVTYSQYRTASTMLLFFEVIVWKKERKLFETEQRMQSYPDDGYVKKDNTNVVIPPPVEK